VLIINVVHVWLFEEFLHLLRLHFIQLLFLVVIAFNALGLSVNFLIGYAESEVGFVGLISYRLLTRGFPQRRVLTSDTFRRCLGSPEDLTLRAGVCETPLRRQQGIRVDTGGYVSRAIPAQRAPLLGDAKVGSRDLQFRH